MINCNPETVSTDYDTSDRLYFEPLTFEDVSAVLDNERPDGVLVQFGGQTPLKLARPLEAAGYPIWGTSPESIDLAEDRGRFGAAPRRARSRRARRTREARDEAEALEAARRIGYPLVVRPSYVLGGRAMAIVLRRGAAGARTSATPRRAPPEHPVLIDRFLDDAVELDVDALCDGTATWIGGIQQHIEEAGIHSGDSFSVLPPWQVPPRPARRDPRRDAPARRGRSRSAAWSTSSSRSSTGSSTSSRSTPARPARCRSSPRRSAFRWRAPAALLAAGRSLAVARISRRSAIPCDFFIKAPVFPFRKFPGEDVAARAGDEVDRRGHGDLAALRRRVREGVRGGRNRLPLSGRAFLTVNPYDKRP